MSSNSFPLFFESTFLSDSSSTIYAVPASPNSQILQELTLKLTNTTSAVRVVTLYAYTSGGASASNAIAYEHTVPAGDHVLVPVPRVGAGGSIEGFCDVANAVNVQAIGGKLHVP